MTYAIIMILTVFDAWATWLGVTRYGIEEGNPFMRWLFTWSVPGACILAVIVTALMLVVVRHYSKQYRWIGYALVGIVAVKVAVAGLHVAWLMLI